jgi:hypothetical protein
MIAYVDNRPSVEPHNGMFLVTVKSGEEDVRLILTRAALLALQHGCSSAYAKATVAEMEAQPVVLRGRRKRS